MEIFSRLPFRLKKQSKEGKEPYPLSKYFCKKSHSTGRKAAVNSLKHYLNKHFLKPISCGRFPYQEGNIGSWFEKEISKNQVDRSRPTIDILNCEKSPGSVRGYRVVTERIKELESKKDHLILYHGTNHKSATNIIECGIRLDKLRKEKRHDFSCGSGFYLTKNFFSAETSTNDGAVNWAFHCWTSSDNQAVLIFKVPKFEIEKYRKEAKIFTDEQDHELLEFAKMFREWTPRDHHLKRKLEGELETVAFVEGRCVKGSRNKIDSSIKGSHQICLISEVLTEQINRYLDHAIFFNRS